MDLTPHVAALRDDLAAAAAVGDEATSRAGSTLAAALEPAVRLALMNALSDLTAEVNDAIDDHHVSLRLRGREVDVVVTPTDGGGDAEPDPGADGGGFFAGPTSSPFAGPGGSRYERPGFAPPGRPSFPGRPGAGAGGGPDVGDISRMTLRIVDQIKGQAERAAAAQGMSLNSWVAQAVQGALHGHAGEHTDRGRHDRWTGGWTGGWEHDDRRGRWPGDRSDGPDTADDERPGGDTESRGSADGGSAGTEGSERPGRYGGSDGDGGDGGVQGWVRG